MMCRRAGQGQEAELDRRMGGAVRLRMKEFDRCKGGQMGSLGCCLYRPARITSAKWNFLAASAACWAVGPLGSGNFFAGVDNGQNL